MSSFRKRRPQSKKSCTECIKAKRRCERSTGACVRCDKQRLDCHFFPPSGLNAEGLIARRKNSTPTNGEENWESNVIQDSTFDFLDFASNDTLQNGVISSSPGIDYLFDLNVDTPQLEHHPFPAIVGPLAPIAPTINGSSCNFISLSSSISSRLEFGIKELKLGPAKMVNENQTAWSHALLYEETMPRTMQDALGACALYLARNETNSRFVFRHVELRVAELLASPAPTSALETLSRTQSLILYQSMRVFDGDIPARAHAEQDMQHLESYALSLQSLISEDDDDCLAPSLQVYPTAHAKAFWSSWLFRESARRTYLICFYFLSMYHLLWGKTRYCDDHPPLMSIWTASAYLWHAASVLDFTHAWNERKHFIVKNLDYTEVLSYATPDDIDGFGKALIISSIGVDEARGWFYKGGGCL